MKLTISFKTARLPRGEKHRSSGAPQSEGPRDMRPACPSLPGVLIVRRADLVSTLILWKALDEI